MKYLKRFNESKETMTDKDRRAVAKKVKADIKDNKDYKDLLSGQKEKFQDKLITKYCKELGFKLSDFYAADGKMISKLLESREEREAQEGRERGRPSSCSRQRISKGENGGRG